MTLKNVMEIHGDAGTTINITSSDVAKAIIHADNFSSVKDSNGKLMQSILITVETNAVRIAFTATPTTSLGHVLAAGSSLRVTNARNLAALKYISAVAGAHGVLQATPEYLTR